MQHELRVGLAVPCQPRDGLQVCRGWPPLPAADLTVVGLAA